MFRQTRVVASFTLAAMLASATGCSSGGGWFSSWRKQPATASATPWSTGANSTAQKPGFLGSVSSFWKKSVDAAAPPPPEQTDALSLSRPTKQPGPDFYVSVARLQEGAGNFGGATEQ